MKKMVRYNGGTESYRGTFTQPTMLIEGHEYEVLYSKECTWITYYVLKGVQGIFNSCWFDEVEEYP